MPEVFASTETTIELLSPIDGSTLITIAYVRDLSMSERPVYVERSYSRSGSVTSNRLRSKGSITLRKDAETLALVRELKRWQQGATLYALATDLKGKTYRHPNLRLTMTNADGTVERQVAYGIRLSDRTLSRPDGGIVGDSISLDVLRGFDLSATEAADNYEPKRALDFHRTGPKTYISTAGTLSTVTDGQAAIGLNLVVRRNLLESSEDLTAATWTKGGTSVLANQAADPKGGYRADKLVESTANSSHECDRLNLALSAVTYTGSVYAKAGERNWIWLGFDDGTTFRLAWFNLATGTVGTAQAGVTATITAEDGGYYRCSVWRTPGASTSVGSFGFGLATADAVTNYTGDGSSGAYFFGAQFEASPSGAPSAYQATNSSGVDLTNPLNGAGLVLEGAGINYVSSPENLASGWTAIAVTATGSAGTAPDGSNAATSIMETATSASHMLYQSPGSVPAGYVTRSIFAKANGRSWCFVSDGGGANAVFYDLANGVVGQQLNGSTGAIESMGSGWYRLIYNRNVSEAGGATTISINPTTGDGVIGAYLGDVTKGILGWGGKVEASPFVTSYHSGTRNADLCGIVSPHNLLKYSEDLTQSNWIKDANCSITKSGAVNLVNFTSAASNGFWQTVTPVTAGAHTWVVRVKKGTLASGNLSFYVIKDVGGAVVSGPSNIAVSSLSSSDYQTFFITATLPAEACRLIFYSSASGTIYVESARLVEGSHPGTYVRTTDTAIPAPTSPALDPAWMQNGAIEFDLVVPPISAAKSFGYFGSPFTYASAANPLQFGRADYAGTGDFDVWFARTHNGLTGSNNISGLSYAKKANFDFNKHKWRLEWVNYKINGVRVMEHRLYYDGALVFAQDAAALFGATAWATIDPTKLISDGNVFATLSNITLGYPALPAGAIPA